MASTSPEKKQDAVGLDSNMNSSNTNDSIDIPTEVLCPHIESPAIVEQMLKENYGLTAIKLKPLNGYDDRNYHVKVSNEHTNPDIKEVSQHGYFLKIINQNDSEQPQLLYAQLSIMDHLIKNGIVCQTTVKGIKGDVFTSLTTPNKHGVDVTYLVTMRSFIPGRVLAEATLSPKFLYKLGIFVATVSKALQGFQDPYYETFDCLWSMNNIPKVAKATFAVQDEKMKKMSEEILTAFADEVVPNKHGFRIGQIHGDLNEQNILVTEDAPNGVPEICGLLDFQDSAKSFPIYDLAINVCYMLMTKHSDVSTLDIPGHILAGYTSIQEITPTEKSAFRTLVASRMVQSLVYGAYTFYLDPTNHYVLETGKCGWKALETFWEADSEESYKRWDNIVNSYK